MSVVQQGSINTTAQIVPGLTVQIVPPSVTLLNGLPTNILGVVGTAQWGPVNAPTIVGSMADYAVAFGAVQARKYDMGTAVAVAVLQGAANFRCVRVTDGSDTAATAVVQTNCLTITGKYTGTLGNTIQATFSAGSKASTTKLTIAMPGQVPEVFDNIAGSGNAFWLAVAAAVNSGQSGLRGPSQLVVASAGVGVTAVTLQTYTLSGGTDGAATISGTVLLGQDTVPRKGMYALRNTGTSVAMLADCDDSTTWTTQVAYGLSEGTYMIMTGPASDTISNAASVKATAGIDSYAGKLLFGDWIYWLDTVNGVTRLISPQGFCAGRLANLSPQHSSLNKPLYGIVGTQASSSNKVYSDAELQQLGLAGIDIITNPIPAGNMFGMRFGHNTSSSAVIHGDNYTRMTNYIAYTLNGGMGVFVGRLQSTQDNDPTRRGVSATLSNFLQGLVDAGMLDAYSVTCDKSNNSDSRIALGYLQADIKAKYLAVVEFLIVNLEGGQSVSVSKSNPA